MLMLQVLVCFLSTLLISAEFTDVLSDVVCDDLPRHILEYLLGSAYNSRYMSIEKPKLPENLEPIGSTLKRSTLPTYEDFKVDSDFYDVLDNRPVWQVENHVLLDPAIKYRIKRATTDITRNKRNELYETMVEFHEEWHCQSKIVWNDLGTDYFPRYLRSVECLSDNCWYGIYRCKPKAFTVKVLRRRRGRCVKVIKNSKIGLSGLPEELRQLWVWEERAVTFCCDCAR